MLIEESLWIKETLEKVNISSLREVLDVGSSTKEFRTRIQPYIDKNIFEPLRNQNISIYHLDKKEKEGVDYGCDVEEISDEKFGRKFDLVICCSLLEHVQKPRELCFLLMNLVKQGGFLLVTVPRTYRYHPDPIDTMFRPSMEELISIFPGMKIIRKKVIRIKNMKTYKKNILELVRCLIPAFNWKVNCLLMRKSKS